MQTATKRRKGPERRERKRGRRIRSLIFCDRKRWVFLPTPGMRLCDDASQPSSICDRAGIALSTTWKRWRELFGRPGFAWLRPYLFGGPRPSEPVQRKLITPEMVSFRREGNRKAVSDAAKKKAAHDVRENTANAASEATAPTACGYQDIERQISLAADVGTSARAFIEDWVFCGGTGFASAIDGLPVRVIRPGEATALLDGFDYVAIEGSDGALNKRQSYREYLARKPASIPPATWVHFLFTGVEPPGWFVLSKVHREIRRKAGFRGRCESAGLNHTRIRNLLKADAALESTVRRAIDNPTAFCREEKFLAEPPLLSLTKSEAAQLWRFVIKSRGAEILADGGGSPSWRSQTLEKAERILGSAGREFVEAFIEGRAIETWRDPRACGEIASRALLPWPGLPEFQEAARRRLGPALRALASIEQDTSHACRVALLLHLTIPDAKLGRQTPYRTWSPPAAPDHAPVETAEDELSAAIAKCQSGPDTEVVRAVHSLCEKRREPFILAKHVAIHFDKLKNGKVPQPLKRRLAKLVHLGALDTGPGNVGYHIKQRAPAT